ncbi:MAG: phosphoribosylformylglycinamidine synthase I [candidate division WOR-3 bacterium]
MVRAALLFAAGTNCDEETLFAFEKAGAKTDRLPINYLKTKKKILDPYSILCIPGGFTYGDYIAAGKILANELLMRLKDALLSFLERGGIILGICNGFQVLVKAGLLPAFRSYFEKPTVTLDWNDSLLFECRWVYLKNNDSPCLFTKDLPPLITLPIAHAEGKFLPKSKKVLERLKINKQIVFTYANEKGEEVGYPYNPNGSIGNVAGICDPKGRIFGLMPHPERFLIKEQFPWQRGNFLPYGFFIFRNAVEYARKILSD